MSLSSHKEWETGLWTSAECQGKSCTAGEIIEYYERRMEEIRKQVSR
jgi:ABC-type Fe3+-hydroxamate transport system substrate-binding protein